MNVFAGGGNTSYNLAKNIMDVMHKEKVSNQWMLFTFHSNVPHKLSTDGTKTIYLAYDSETKVTDKTIWDEIAHFDSNEPDLILCVDRTSYNFYKKYGLPAEYIPMGYDDLNYKEANVERKHGIGFIGSIDEQRNSIFHERYLMVSDLMRQSKIYHPTVGNQINYNKINEEYSKCVVGLNDIILGINQRCFEIPVAGAAMLVNSQIRDSINKEYPLKENKHYIVYDLFSDMMINAKAMIENGEATLKMGERAKKVALRYPFSKGVIKVIDKWKMR